MYKPKYEGVSNCCKLCLKWVVKCHKVRLKGRATVSKYALKVWQTVTNYALKEWRTVANYTSLASSRFLLIVHNRLWRQNLFYCCCEFVRSHTVLLKCLRQMCQRTLDQFEQILLPVKYKIFFNRNKDKNSVDIACTYKSTHEITKHEPIWPRSFPFSMAPRISDPNQVHWSSIVTLNSDGACERISMTTNKTTVVIILGLKYERKCYKLPT